MYDDPGPLDLCPSHVNALSDRVSMSLMYPQNGLVTDV
jgi:hypothetical protein